MMGRATQPSHEQGAEVAAGIVSKMLGGESAADQARMKDAMSTLAKMGEQAEKADDQPQ